MVKNFGLKGSARDKERASSPCKALNISFESQIHDLFVGKTSWFGEQ